MRSVGIVPLVIFASGKIWDVRSNETGASAHMTLSVNRELGVSASSNCVAVVQIALNHQPISPVPGMTAPLAELVAAGIVTTGDGTATSNQDLSRCK